MDRDPGVLRVLVFAFLPLSPESLWVARCGGGGGEMGKTVAASVGGVEVVQFHVRTVKTLICLETFLFCFAFRDFSEIAL